MKGPPTEVALLFLLGVKRGLLCLDLAVSPARGFRAAGLGTLNPALALTIPARIFSSVPGRILAPFLEVGFAAVRQISLHAASNAARASSNVAAVPYRCSPGSLRFCECRPWRVSTARRCRRSCSWSSWRSAELGIAGDLALHALAFLVQ